MQELASAWSRPFLIQPELWYNIIPQLSYRDFVNTFSITKGTDNPTEVKDNFVTAQRIWSQYTSLDNIVDTLYHAALKKADQAFASIIQHRNKTASESKFDACEDPLHSELREQLMQDPHPANSNIQKIALICAKAKYHDLLNICIESLSINDLFHLLFEILEEQDSATIEIIKNKIYTIYALDENRKKVIKLVSNADPQHLLFLLKDRDFFPLPYVDAIIGKSLVEKNIDLFIGAMEYVRKSIPIGYDNRWKRSMEALLAKEENDFILEILRKTPWPSNNILISFLLICPEEIILDVFSSESIEKFNVQELQAGLVLLAMLHRKRETVEIAIDKIGEGINGPKGLAYCFSKLNNIFGSKLQFECPDNLAANYPLILKSQHVTKKTLTQIAFYLPLPQDFKWGDTDLFSKFKVLSNPNGQPLMLLDESTQRVYACPHKNEGPLRDFSIRFLHGLYKIDEAISLVANHVFNLISSLFTRDLAQIKFHAVRIAFVPLAVLGMEIGIFLEVIFPWRGSKLYYACSMALISYSPSYDPYYSSKSLFQAPPFLFRPLPLELSQALAENHSAENSV